MSSPAAGVAVAEVDEGTEVRQQQGAGLGSSVAGSSRLESALLPRARGLSFPSAFEVEMASTRAALGDSLVNLASGDPDLPTPPHICAAAIAAIKDGATHYTPKNGMPALRGAISAHLASFYGLQYDADEVCVTAGVQEALASCFLALTGAGDEVLVPFPTYLSYEKQGALLGGATVVQVPCRAEHDFVIQAADIKAALTPRSKVLVHVSPNNPTGAVTPPATVRSISALALEHDLIVVSDEIYSDMLYEGHGPHLSIASLPGMRERTVVLNGCSKAFAMTGWRVGYLAAPRPFVEAITTIAGQLSLSVATPSQHAALAAFRGPAGGGGGGGGSGGAGAAATIGALMKVYSKRRRYMFGRLQRMGFKIFGGHGGYIALLDTASGPGGLAAPEFCLRLLQATGIQMGSWGAGMAGELERESGGRYARISWLVPMLELERAMDAMEAWLEGGLDSGGSAGGASKL